MRKCLTCAFCELYSGDNPCRHCKDYNLWYPDKPVLIQWLTANTDTIETQAGVKMNVVDVDELRKFIENNPK